MQGSKATKRGVGVCGRGQAPLPHHGDFLGFEVSFGSNLALFLPHNGCSYVFLFCVEIIQPGPL